MMKPLFISQGRYEFNANLFMDQIPRRITLGLVSNSDYVGDIKRSPFNFHHFNVREISIIANGRNYPQAPYDFDYENGKYVRAFNDMNEAVGLSNSTESNGITLQQYGKTHCIYVFNLTNSGEDQGGTFDLIKNGTTAVNIKFSKPVPDGGIMLIVMGEADSLIMLDKNRTIASDTTHTTVEKLHEFLISTLQHQSETYGASPLEKPEDLVDLPSLKRQRNKRSLEELRQIRVGIIPKVDEVFIDYPDQYWDQIKILKDKLKEDSKSLDEFKLRTDQEQDETIKSEMTTTFWNLSYKRSALESRIRKLEEEAKRRDFEKNNSDVNIVVDFFETYPENYNEILIIDHLKLIALFIEDRKEKHLQLEGFLPRFKKEIER
uniref:Uncharacterized protein n=1 Tax=Meloidogyne incognita TaxID=6306 RepID=A0A914NMD2_MELIC